MRVLCVLLVCVLGFASALPPRYYAVPSQVDDDDDADVEDAPYDNDEGSFDDMFTFPTGGPGGPPRNKYMDGPGARQARTENQLVSYPGKYYFSYDSDPNTLYPGTPLEDEYVESEDESPQYARRLVRKDNMADKQEDEEEDEEQEDEEDDDQDDQDDDSEPAWAVPDMNKLFPQPNQAQQAAAGGRGPSRRYRYVEPTTTYYDVNSLTDSYDTVVIDADESERSRRIPSQAPYEEEDEEQDEQDEDPEQEDEGDQDDDVDFNVPSYDTLFPNPGNKQVSNPNLLGSMRNTWDNAPRPPGGPSGRYARVIRLFQSPLHHDNYNPDYVIDPQIAFERRNQRMRYRYSNPNWKLQNTHKYTPYNYKPILYQQGHWGSPKEHDYNPISGDHYLGGIYNGKTYY